MARGDWSWRSAIYAASRILNNIGAGVLMAMMLLVVVDVILRNVLNSPILGSYEIVQYMMVVMVFFFFAHAQAQKANVRVTMLVAKLPVRVRTSIEAVCYLVATVYFAAITIQMAREGYAAFLRGDLSPTLFLPHYLFVFMTVVGAGFMSLVLLIDFFTSLDAAIKGEILPD